MSLRTATETRLGFVRWYPADLAAVSVAAVAAYLVVTSHGFDGTLRLLMAIPLILFLPGYALVSVLFPAAARRTRENALTGTDTRPGGIDAVERLGLAFALSIALVPMVTIGLALTDWGLATEPVAAALAIGTIGFAQLGVVRRLRVPAADRFTVSPILAVQRLRQGDETVATASTLFLAFAVVVAGLSLVAAFAMPHSASEFTELGLYTEDGDGDLVAGQLPSTVDPGESIPVTISVENHEGESKAYTAVVQQQVLADDEVVDRTRLTTVSASSDDGEVVTVDREITPTVGDGRVRIVVLLYEGDVPGEPTRENADEDAFFWVTVTDGGDTA
ncbi:DUF1616 domain-containing protein [Natribaculum luteum]|uniref:DUF1616 domain-containing protein n=1 Tax=Natribaculum luteum TaxID=1586232 RepID=A0ABD5P437_9EURY|nr:DUF1616 domain-containing protein [Natribaculum luteum]